MSYRVVITANAKSNLRSYYLHAAQHAPLTAVRWLNRFETALATLNSNAQRCELAAENDMVDAEVRQLLFGASRSVFRALFTIVENEVRILHIRRATMGSATSDEILG